MTVIVRTTSGETLQSDDGGKTYSTAAAETQLTSPAEVRSGDDRWRINAAGRVLHARGSASLQPDRRGPHLGAGAHLLAAPAALPGVVVAVARDGTVWRRGADGGWGQSLLLLPASLTRGVPTVTAVAAFTRPLTGTVYLSTDGYSVLLSTDGGDDWIRANPGLPESVHALSADAATRSVYAATSDGVFVHRLQAFPGPAAYHDSALVLRWVGLALVALVSAALAALALSLLATRPAAPPAAPG